MNEPSTMSSNRDRYLPIEGKCVRSKKVLTRLQSLSRLHNLSSMRHVRTIYFRSKKYL
jgi:hypothetical protein